MNQADQEYTLEAKSLAVERLICKARSFIFHAEPADMNGRGVFAATNPVSKEMNALNSEGIEISTPYFADWYTAVDDQMLRPRGQQRVNVIVTTPATTREYPNDTLINQLVNYTLMYCADPNGDFGWTPALLQDEVKTLGNSILGQDPASRAIATALQRHEKTLRSAPSYPMVELYAQALAPTSANPTHCLPWGRPGPP